MDRGRDLKATPARTPAEGALTMSWKTMPRPSKHVIVWNKIYAITWSQMLIPSAQSLALIRGAER